MRGLLTFAVFCLLASTASAQTYQVDAARSGNASGARLGSALTVAWSAVTTPQGTDYSVVAPGRVYTVGQVEEHAAALALDSATGAVLWAVPFAKQWSDGPYVTLAGDTLIASTGSVVVALDAATGERRWTSSFGGTASAPVVADGLVLAARWRNYDGANVVALRLADGALAWTGATMQRNANPTVAAGLVFNMVGCGALASRLVDGTTAWVRSPECGHHRAGSAFDGERVWAGLESRGAVYDPVTGTIGGYYEGGVPSFSGDLAVSVREGSLVAYDRRSLVERWRFKPPAALVSAPLIADGVVYATDDPGNVYSVDAATGTLLASVPTGVRSNWQGEFAPGLAAGAGLLIVPTENGIVALRGNGAPPMPTPMPTPTPTPTPTANPTVTPTPATTAMATVPATGMPSAAEHATASPTAPPNRATLSPSLSTRPPVFTRAKALLDADRTRLARSAGRRAAAGRALRRLDTFRRTAPRELSNALALHRRGLVSYRAGYVRQGRRLLARAALELRSVSTPR